MKGSTCEACGHVNVISICRPTSKAARLAEIINEAGKPLRYMQIANAMPDTNPAGLSRHLQYALSAGLICKIKRGLYGPVTP